MSTFKATPKGHASPAPNASFQSDRIRNAQRHERLRDMMTTKIAKMVEHGTNKGAVVTKQRKQSDNDGGTLGALTQQEVEYVRNEVDLLLHTGDATEGSLNRIAMQVRMMADTRKKGGGSGIPQPKPRIPSSASNYSQVASEAAPSTSVPAASTAVKRDSRKPGAAGLQDARVSVHAYATSTSNPLNPAGSLQPSSPPRNKFKDVTPERVARTKQFTTEDPFDPWALLQEKEKEAFCNEIVMQRRATRKKEDEQREVLDQQVQRRMMKKQELIQEERARAREEAKLIKEYEDQEFKRKMEIKKKHEEEKRMLEEQAALSKQRKLEEKLSYQDEERKRALAIQKAIELEKEALIEEKRAVRQEREKFHEFNKANKDIHRIQKEKEAKEDHRLQQEFLAKLAKEEGEREEALAKLHERMTRQAEMAHKMQTKWQEKSSDDERKAREFAAKKAAAEEAEERAKREREELQKIKLRQALALQVKDKEEKKAKAREEFLSYKKVFSKEVEAAQQDELQRRLLHKKKIEEQRALLEAQLKEREKIKVVTMTEAEKQINSRLLEKAAASKF